MIRVVGPTDSLTDAERHSLHEKWGEQTVTKELARARQLFEGLDQGRVGVLDLDDFSRALGLLGCNNSSWAKILFKALDINDDGQLSFYEFLNWMLTVLHGTTLDKIMLGYRLMDLNHDNKLTKQEMLTTLQSLFDILATLKVDVPDLHSFVEKLWDRLNVADEESLGQEAYCKEMLKNISFVKSFGRDSGENLPQRPSNMDNVHAPCCQVFFGHPLWDMVVLLMCALQVTMEKAMGEPRLNLADYAILDRSKIRFVDRVKVRGRVGSHVCVNSYYPQLYRELRHMSGIDDQAFLDATGINQAIASLLLGDLTTMSGMSTQGKSSSYFFYSHDGNILIKTVCASEYYSLRSSTVDYFEHITKYPNTLLSRFYGLYKIKESHTTYFVVMGNAFSPTRPMDLRFDLKGSTVGRTSLGDGIADYTDHDVIYKDLDWLGSARRLSLGPIKAREVWEQLQHDCAYLRSHNIIDYSLLVGIYYPSVSPAEQFRQYKEANADVLLSAYERLCGPCKTADPAAVLMPFDDFCWSAFSHAQRVLDAQEAEANGVTHKKILPAGFGPMKSYQADEANRVQVGEYVVYLCIIDILITYDTFKASEHVLKAAIYNKREVSVAPPPQYQKRFLRFIRQDVLDGLEPFALPDTSIVDLPPAASSPRLFSGWRSSSTVDLTSENSSSKTTLG